MEKEQSGGKNNVINWKKASCKADMERQGDERRA